MASETLELNVQSVADALIDLVKRSSGDGRPTWYLSSRVLADGRVLYLTAMFGGLQLGISPNASAQFYVDVFAYQDQHEAWRAVLGWNGQGDPEGWVRHYRGGDADARRRPDGTPDSEYRAP